MSGKDYSVYEEFTPPRELDEEALELAYWTFMDNLKKNNVSDRDYFKYVMRGFARKEIDRYIKEQEQKEIETLEEYKRELRESNFILRKFYKLRRWVRNL